MLEKSLVEESGNNSEDNELEKQEEEKTSHHSKESSSSQEIASDVVESVTTTPLALKQPKNRSTRLELADTLRKIRHLIGQAHTNEEIMSMLNLLPATFYRYLDKIHAQDRELFLQQDIEAIEFEAHTLKDKLIRAERWYNKMADDESLGAGYRMQAKYAATDVAVAILKLTNDGLINVDKVRRFAKTGTMMPQEFPQLYNDVVDPIDGTLTGSSSSSSSRQEVLEGRQ
jgi:hypothetical protein